MEDIKQPTTVPVGTEYGDTGTTIFSGFLTDIDYNPDLTGTKRVEIYDQMKLGDATVRLGLNSVKFPILSRDWYIKSNAEGGEETEHSKFIKKQLFENPHFTWTSLLRQVLTFCEYGNAIFEKVYVPTPDGKIGWKKFGHRLSKTIYRWTMQDGHTPGLTQILPTKGTKEIPGWKLMYFVLDKEGDNFEGISLLRSAYKHWFMKDSYYRIDAVATEKQGLGVPQLTTPPNAKPEDIRKAREVVSNMRAHQQSYVELPMGFKVEFLDMKANQIKSAMEMANHHDQAIARAFLAQFLMIGSQASSGSYNASEDQSELFYLGLQQVAKTAKEPFDQEIRFLIDLNFGPQEVYPTLEHSKLQRFDSNVFATALKALADGQIIIPDDELEKDVRKSFELPDKQEGYDRETIEKKKAEQAKAEFENNFSLEKEKANGFIKSGGKDKDRPQDRPVKKLVNDESYEFIEDVKDLRDDIRSIFNEQHNTN